MKKTDGSTCQTPEENAEVFREHFQKLYEREADYDPTVIDMIHQEAIVEGLDHEPSDEEIKEALEKLHDSGPGYSGLKHGSALWSRRRQTYKLTPVRMYVCMYVCTYVTRYLDIRSLDFSKTLDLDRA